MNNPHLTVIAEIGLNHNGDFAVAQEMAKRAADAGADIVKFQFYDPVKVLGKDSPVLDYAIKSQFNRAQHQDLKALCDKLGVEYLVSVFDPVDVVWANGLCARHKVASRMCQDAGFRAELLKTGKPIIVSLGAPYGLQNDLGAKVWADTQNVSRMACITEYPAPAEHFALLGANALSGFDGLSSHCPSIAPALCAVAWRSTIIESHVTLDPTMPGCDQSSSWTFDQLALFISQAADMDKVLWGAQ